MKKGIPYPTYNTGTKLRRLRAEKGVTQSELAAKSGIPIKTIQRFEQNTTPIDGVKLNTLCDLCIALNCGIGDILESGDLKEKFKKVVENDVQRNINIV